MNAAYIHFIELFEKLGIKIFRIMCGWIVIVLLNSRRFVVFHLPHEGRKEKNMYCYFVTKKTNTYSNDYKRK
jgi:hypothetical protein